MTPDGLKMISYTCPLRAQPCRIRYWSHKVLVEVKKTLLVDKMTFENCLFKCL